MLVIRIRTSWCGNGSGSLPAREQPAAQAPGVAVGQMGISSCAGWRGRLLLGAAAAGDAGAG